MVRRSEFGSRFENRVSPFWQVAAEAQDQKCRRWQGEGFHEERTVSRQKALSVALREGEPTDGVDLLLDLHRSQEVEFTIVALELCVKLVRLLVRLLLQDYNLTAIVADS